MHTPPKSKSSTQEKFEAFILELGTNKGLDVNQPTPKGRMPILEAVRSRKLEYIDALLQVGTLHEVHACPCRHLIAVPHSSQPRSTSRSLSQAQRPFRWLPRTV